MFSLWPELFDLSLIAVTLLRLTAGYFFVLMGIRLLRAVRAATSQRGLLRSIGALYGSLQLGVGALLVAGLFTQGAALLGAILTLLPVGSGKKASACEQHVQLLLFAIAASLILLGPGIFAIDKPI